MATHSEVKTENAQFTPGPWEVSYDDQNGQAVVASEHTEVATCWHHCVGSLEEEMRHNARLIAAAPELYDADDEALNFLAAEFGHVSDPDNPEGWSSLDAFGVYKQLRDALAKARCES